MRKNDLIKMLQELEGNPEVMLWNGYVGDYMHISPRLIEGDLVKQTYEHYEKMVEFEKKRDANDWNVKLTIEEIAELKETYKRVAKWEVNEFVTREDLREKRWKAKRVVYVNAKPRGETHYDRLGPVSY